MAEGEYAQALGLLIEQNRYIMKARNSAAPWIEVRAGKVEVRFRDDYVPSLPEWSALPDLWIHSYFLDSLRTIASALRE
jgi:hypothetical protein